MNNNDGEKRLEKRIMAADLPDSFQVFTLLLPGEGLVKAITTDASLSGFGLLVEAGADNFIIGTNLVIYPLGEDNAIYGRIIFVQQISSTATRVGLSLLPSASYNEYKKIIQNIH